MNVLHGTTSPHTTRNLIQKLWALTFGVFLQIIIFFLIPWLITCIACRIFWMRNWTNATPGQSCLFFRFWVCLVNGKIRWLSGGWERGIEVFFFVCWGLGEREIFYVTCAYTSLAQLARDGWARCCENSVKHACKPWDGQTRRNCADCQTKT